MANIYYHDIGDYLDRNEKLQIIAEADGLQGIDWQTITPNEKHDWINQRGNVFDTFIAICAKRDNNTSLSAQAIFDDYSNGLKTNRDAWCYTVNGHKLAFLPPQRARGPQRNPLSVVSASSVVKKVFSNRFKYIIIPKRNLLKV